ncbi:hypothetical protein BG015_009704 [Linnemannia schmuckeri]|uniref:BTB domain-containing protein n=1 Tax=Linnemannia schmuckeri TaxID=64567 RepID=A0A9P5RV32_9FUNG|nr:hypothetical protein BG015_009704 [Linnemannia schmuckeri]
MDNDNNQEDALIRNHQQQRQQEQPRQRLQQQQQHHHQHLRFDPRLGQHQGHNQFLTSAFPLPPSSPQQYSNGSGIPPTPLQQHQHHSYEPFSMASSLSSSADPRSEQFMSSSSRNSTFAQQQQYPTGPQSGRVAQGPAEEMYRLGGGGMSAEAREQEAEALAIHRQYQQRLLQEQHQRRASPSTPATPRLPAVHPFQSLAPNIPHWHQQQQLQQPQHMWRIQPPLHQTSQQSQFGSVGMSSSPLLAPAQSTTTGRQRSSPRLSSPTSGRHASSVSSSSSSLHPGGSALGFGRVNPYPPPQLTSRSQSHQYHRRSGVTIDVDALPTLNPDPALRQHDHSQQGQQSQRAVPPSLPSTSRPFAGPAGRAPFTSPPPVRMTPPPPPAYDFGGGDSDGDGNGDGLGYDSACLHQPRPVETVLPAQAPISIYGPRNNDGNMGDDGGAGGDLEMDYILEEEEQGPPPIEVTLNVDIPKSSRPPTEGVPSTTVLNVNPSWHVVFVETIQHQRIRTSIRIQFCPSSSTARLIEHRSKVRRLQTVQVIGYASRRVELSRRIQGQTLLNRGGLIIHLDPASITFNEASYGFTLSLTSFEMDQLSRTRNSRPDIPLSLARQQNSAYCRRNLKEMYYDTISKDVAITLRPSGEVFYAHSIVLESHAYFRALVEQQNQSRGSPMAAGQDAGEEGTGMAVEIDAVVDEEGYAQPLRPQLQQRSLDDQGSSRYPYGGAGPFGTTGGGGNGSGLASQDRSRAKTVIEVNDTSPTVFRAVLHFMYMGHVPVTGIFANQTPQPQQSHQQTPALSASAAQTNTPAPTQDTSTFSMSAAPHAMNPTVGTKSGSGTSSMTGLDVLTAAAALAATEAASGASSSPLSGSCSALETSPLDLPMGPPPSSLTPTVSSAAALTPTIGATTTVNANASAAAATAPPATAATTTIVGEFPWREVYEIAARYQLSGLMHLAKVALISRLDVNRAIQELFEWAYHHKPLIPAYVSFLIERVDATVLNGRRSILWPYHDLCPAYDEIMMDFMRLLSERKNANTLI